MHLKPFILAAAVFLPPMCFGAVNVISQNFDITLGATSNPIAFKNNLAPAGSGVVAVGLFGAGDAAADALVRSAAGDKGNWAAAVAGFTVFGAPVTMGTGAGNTMGLFQTTPGISSGGAEFYGRNVYVVIGNASSLAASRQVVVFKSDTTYPPFLDPTPGVDAFLTDIAIGLGLRGTLLLGEIGEGKVWYTSGPLGNQTLSAIIASDVPEPSPVVAAILVPTLTLVRRRRVASDRNAYDWRSICGVVR